MPPNGSRLSCGPPGAADKKDGFQWACRQKRRRRADSFKRRLGGPLSGERGEGWSASRKPELLEHERLIELLPALAHLPADDPVDD